MSWNIRAFELAVRERHGNCIADALHEPLQAIFWKFQMSHFHACESLRILNEVIREFERIEEGEPDHIAAGRLILQAASKHPQAPNLSEARFQAEAHMIAASQALHSTADIMAHAVYWALNLPSLPEPPNLDTLNLGVMLRQLRRLQVAESVRVAMENVEDLSEFIYLNAYVNTTKHRSLVKANFTAHLDPNDNPQQGMLIKPFEHKGRQFSEKWAKQFLFEEKKRVAEAVVNIGYAVDAYIGEDNSIG